MMVELAERMRARGLEVREVTAGGTVTGRYVAEVEGITEVRAGTYVFNDLMQLNEGSASGEELALSVLCTVVSRHGTAPGCFTIDGGTKTFSGDHGAIGGAAGHRSDQVVARSVDGRAVIERMTEEHGMGHSSDQLRVGEKLRFYPFHACTCNNLASEIFAVRDDRVCAVWPVAARGLRA
jgi:D-serine deaminase-like pyridoxal phosphate-dependent protein